VPQQAGPDGSRWWQRGAIYHVYVQPFQDSNGDGIGDLPGVARRLDYIESLGVDAIWLSPIYPSPMADSGYDVADYKAVSPVFGTLADFDALLRRAHGRGLRVILDFVPNHTSVEHPWFVESRSSVDNPKRDWYIWSNGRPGGGPPNNWLSNFGGSAWTLDERTGQYYYHAVLRQQPDLNWRNPAVREAVHDAMRFWLSRGVDGFRMNVIWQVIKDEQLRDNPPNPSYLPHEPEQHRLSAVYSTDRPEVHRIIAEMRAVVDEYPDRLLIGEIYLPVERLVAYYGDGGEGVHLPFNFQLVLLPWDARHIDQAIQRYEQALPPFGWPNWVWATTTSRASRPASAPSRRASPRCCCSRCAERQPSTMATRLACAIRRCRPSACATRSSGTCRGGGSAATRSARRCSGMDVRLTPASPMESLGCLSPRITRWSTSRARRKTRLPC